MRHSPIAALVVLLTAAACAHPAPAPSPTPAHPHADSANAAQEHPGRTRSAEPHPRPYREVVTPDAVTRQGMFTIHRIGQKLLFEIPRDQLGKDELLVTEIAKTVHGSGYGGQAVSNRVYRWQLRDNRMYLRTVSYEVMADSATPEYRAVQAANVSPIVAAFDVEAYGPDSSAVIDVTHLFTDPPAELGPGERIPGNVDSDRSWIERATPFPDNVNVFSTLTYAQHVGSGSGSGSGRGGFGFMPNRNPSNTIVMSWSFHRLPDVPMKPRLCDDRVGYFSVRFTDFANVKQQVETRCYITRWRLVKKDPSAAVSDPVKPIVFYIDPATPKKWIPWLEKAVDAWQPAFEAAGFSHAIMAKEAPDDPDWSPEDARYSVIRWLPSTVENASGPNVHDPRSGEILDAHIQFYQNVQRLVRSWYFTQASASDPRARSFPLPDSLMGRLMEYVLTHEVGHTLGLTHNMKASSMYPVDSLRSASFLRKWGDTPSIMDYARFDYVAQPEDHVPPELLIPRIGPYDKWAIMWGYKPIPSAATAQAERPTLDAWAREQDRKPWLRFNTAGSAGSDPGQETEAVGDQDAVRATRLGLANLKREVNWLIPATRSPTKNWDDLASLYGDLVGQWRTELTHVTNIVGAADSQEKYGSQTGVIFTPVDRVRQKRAVAFLLANAFHTPDFLLYEPVLRRIEPSGSVARISQAQSAILGSLLRENRLDRMSEYAHDARPGTAYTPLELLEDVQAGLFSELSANAHIDVYRRALQRAYVDNLIQKIVVPSVPTSPGGSRRPGGRPTPPHLELSLSDVQPVARAALKELNGRLERAMLIATGMKRAHLDDLHHRIDEALDVNADKGADR